MYRITILTIGTLKESYWREAMVEYVKRLTPYARLEIKELSETPFRSASDKARVIADEGERIMAQISADAAVILCDVAGRSVSSEEFAPALKVKGESGAHLVFVLGGPLGVSEALQQRAQLRLSLSLLTFTHQLARIVLAEQLYRAMTIIHGKAYHY